MKKLIKIASLIIAIIFIITISIVIIIGLIPFDIRKPSYKLMKSASLDSVYMEKGNLRLPDNFKYKNLIIKNRLSKTHSLNLNLRTLQGDIRILHTISNREEVLRRLKGKFNWKFKQGKDHHLPFIYKQFTGADTIFVPIIEILSLKDGAISIDSLGSNTLAIDGLNIKLKTEEYNHPSLSASINAKDLNLYNILLKDIKGEFDLEKEMLEIPQLAGNIADGKFKIKKASLNMEQNKLYNVELSVKDAILEKLFTLENGKLGGILDLSSKADTSFISLKDLKGRGNLSIKNLSAEDIPLLKKAVRITDIKSLRSVKFEKLETDFIVDNNRISSDSIIATGENFSLYGSGYLKPENLYFNYKVKGIFESHMKDSMSSLVWDALLPMKDGRKYFKCTISGTPKRPGIDLEREMVKSAAKSIFRSIKKDFKSLFK